VVGDHGKAVALDEYRGDVEGDNFQVLSRERPEGNGYSEELVEKLCSRLESLKLAGSKVG
jgi:hypothetical protein